VAVEVAARRTGPGRPAAVARRQSAAVIVAHQTVNSVLSRPHEPQDATEYIWLAWLMSWFAAAVFSARTVRRPSLRRQLWYRLTTASGALLMFARSGSAL